MCRPAMGLVVSFNANRSHHWALVAIFGPCQTLLTCCPPGCYHATSFCCGSHHASVGLAALSPLSSGLILLFGSPALSGSALPLSSTAVTLPASDRVGRRSSLGTPSAGRNVPLRAKWSSLGGGDLLLRQRGLAVDVSSY